MNKLLFPLVFISLLNLGCSTHYKSKNEDHFFVSNDGSSMPVYVKGNFESNVIILFLHGGPGGNASQATFIPSFKELEELYAVAYWDQRGSGLSQGNPSKETFTVNQFVEDTYYVISSIKERYQNKKVFIFGHSWGGALGAAFLSTSNYQDDIAGFICMNSGHNLEIGLPLSVEWVKNYADEQILMDNNKNYWQEVSNWCHEEPDMTVPDNYFQYINYLDNTDAYRHNNKDVVIDNVSTSDILNSRLSLAALVGGQYLAKNFNILELNLSNEMATIKIPSLVIWGKHDGVNTLEMGYDAYNSIGSDSTKKELLILQNSAHEGYLEQPSLFVSSFVNFIEQYKN